MQNLKKVLIPLAILLVVILGFWILKQRDEKTPIENEQVVRTYKASLTLNLGITNQTFDISQYIGKTALEATQGVLTGDVITTGTGANAYVTSLVGLAADTKKKRFWELDVNGKEAQVGAGTYVIQNNDNILWKINTY